MNTIAKTGALLRLRDNFTAWSRALMTVQSWILLSAVYVAILSWFVLFVKAKGSKKTSSGWSRWSLRADTLDDVRRQG